MHGILKIDGFPFHGVDKVCMHQQQGNCILQLFFLHYFLRLLTDFNSLDFHALAVTLRFHCCDITAVKMKEAFLCFPEGQVSSIPNVLRNTFGTFVLFSLETSPK